MAGEDHGKAEGRVNHTMPHRQVSNQFNRGRVNITMTDIRDSSKELELRLRKLALRFGYVIDGDEELHSGETKNKMGRTERENGQDVTRG